MQTDDTLILYNNALRSKEETERKGVDFIAKPIKIGSLSDKLILDGCILSKQGLNVVVMQKR